MDRGWWGVLGRRRTFPQTTYTDTSPDDLPDLDRSFDGSFDWLRDAPRAPEWGIGTSDPERNFDPATAHAADAAVRAADLAVPPALLTFLTDPALIARIRSFTACWIDLAARPAWMPEAEAHVLRFLADQQGLLYWYAVLDGPEAGAVIASNQYVDAEADADDWSDPDEPRTTVRCADDVESFLYRFWLENEIAFHAAAKEPLDPTQRAYLERRSGPGPGTF